MLLLVLALAPAGLVHAEDTHTRHVETDAAGTTVKTETSHDKTVGWTGTKKSTSEVETVVDPKGLGNKLVARSQVETKVKPSGDFSESKTIEHADGTKEHATTAKETSNNWLDKGKTTTTTQTHTVDPKGLGNKHEIEVTETVEFNADGTKKSTVSKTVDGDKVLEKTTTP